MRQSVAYWYTRADGMIVSVLPGVGGRQREHLPRRWPSGRVAKTLEPIDPPPDGPGWWVNGGVWQQHNVRGGDIPKQRNPIRRKWWQRFVRRARRLFGWTPQNAR